jgi:hypothetical protein
MSCAEPVSWLRLERRELGELGGEELAAVEGHLAGCPACAEVASGLRGWQGKVPALPAVRVRRRWPWLFLAAPAAAALALVLWPRPPVGLKGSDVAMTLVRERAGDIDLDPRTFAPTDRFKVLVTCPTPNVLPWEVVVYQQGQASHPFDGRPAVPCANRVPLPGAIRLFGSAPVTVCLLWGDGLDRRRTQPEGQATADPQARCERLTPQLIP